MEQKMGGQVRKDIAKTCGKDNSQMKLAKNFVQWPPLVLTDMNHQILWSKMRGC
jgi:hypothetical protein